MKQYLIKLSQAILLCIVVFFSSCENNQLEVENSATSIASAKNWYDGFKTKVSFQPIFNELVYNWQDASTTNLNNGSQVIKVPVLFPNEAPEYYGHKLIYFYPINSGTAFDVSLVEFIPNPKKVQTEQRSIDLIAFDGYIIHWDLVKGFVRGSKFERNLAVNDIDLKIEYTKTNSFTLRQAAGDPWEIALKEVIIVQRTEKKSVNDGGAGFDYIIRNNASFGTGVTSSNYANGGGGGSSNSGNNAPPSCESFNFKKKAGSLWQEAAVKNIHFKIVVIGPNGYKFSQIIEYPNAILFGAPTNLAIGNTDISAGLASTLSAKAIEASMSETVSMYGNKPVSELTVRLYFEERLRHNYPLFIPGGRVNFNASGFSGTPSNYKTNMFGTGNCD